MMLFQRVWRRYLFFAVVLTALWLLARSVAPVIGLTRSFYYPLERPTASLVERTTAIDLAFIDEQRRPDRFYRVRWHGVWFSPRPERVDFYAGADDAVVVRVDGEIVLERNPTVGMHTEGRTVELDAGAHRLEIDHWQRGGGRHLNAQWAPVGGTPRALSPSRLFEQDPGAFAYWLLVASSRLQTLVLLVWAAGPTILLGRMTILLGWMVYRTASVMTARDLRTRVRTVLFPALLGPCQVLLFGPLTVHTTNRAEFLAPFWSLALQWVWWLAPVVGTLVAIGLILPARWFARYVAVLFAIGVLLWIQGNILLADYGPLDGGGLDLTTHAWRAPFELGLWIGAIALAAGCAAAIAKTAPVASQALLAVQFIVLLLPAVMPTAPSTSAASPRWRLPPPEIYQLSGTRNLIHIVLDMFPTERFVAIVDADRSTFDRDLSGFTVFADHLGAFPTTKASMPAMLTGVAYRNEMPFRDFLARRANVSVFHALGQQEFRLRVVSSLGSDYPTRAGPGVDTAIRYNIPVPYSTSRDYLDFTAAQLLDLSLFRHAPHGAKARIYRNQQWLVQQWLAARRSVVAERPFSDAAFLLEFARRVTLGGNDPVYTFMHLLTPHPPIVTHADCTYPGQAQAITVESYTAQAECALMGVRALFNRLRELDIYDSSAILLTSDHGIVIGPSPMRSRLHTPAGPLDHIALRATPLLAIKPAGSTGPLQTSYAPTAITDIPATIFDLVGLPNILGHGVSAFALDAATPRTRTYANHPWNNAGWASPYFDVLHVFTVTGRVTTPESWRYQQAIVDPTNE